MSVGHVKDYNEQISLGDKYLEEMDYENTEVCYNKAIHFGEKQARPYLQLAVLYHDWDRQEEALDILERGEKNKAYSEAEEESVKEIRETINSEMRLKQYQMILDEYNRTKGYDATYLCQNQEEFPNVDDEYAEFLSVIHYCLYDIDKKGVEELLLFCRFTIETGSYKDELFDVYAYNGETAEKLFFKEPSERHGTLNIYTDGTIYVLTAGESTSPANIDFCKLGNDGYTLIAIESYKMDKKNHQDAPYYNDSVSLTESQFEEKLSSYTEIETDELQKIDVPIWNSQK